MPVVCVCGGGGGGGGGVFDAITTTWKEVINQTIASVKYWRGGGGFSPQGFLS